MSEPTTDTWAFWRYDLYPYLLSGKIARPMKGTQKTYYLDGYGGHTITAEFTLAGEAGRELHLKLKALGQEKAIAEALLKKTLNRKRDALLAEYGVLSPAPH